MIISIRGTSGSGKTYLIYRLMELYEGWEPKLEGNKILGYTRSNWFIVGRYQKEIQTGGLDSLIWGRFEKRKARMDFIEEKQKQFNVICEGLMESNEVGRTVTWPDVHAFFIDTPLKDCMEYINQRRLKRGITEPVNPYKTTVKHAELMRVHKRLLNAGVDSRYLNREEAFKTICQLMDSTTPSPTIAKGALS